MQNISSLFNFFKLFPTEKSRYSACRKLFIWGCVIAPIVGILLSILSFAVEYGIIQNTAILIISTIFTLVAVAIHLFYMYTSCFLFIKTGILKNILKILFMYILTFIFFAIISAMITPIFASLLTIIIALIAFRKRRKMLSKYHNYVKYLGYPLIGVYVFINIAIFLLLGSAFFSQVTHAESISSFLNMGALVCVIAIFAWPLYGIFKLMSVEEANGTPFATMYKLSWLVPFSYLLMIFSVINLIPTHFFSADTLVADIDFEVNNGINDIPEYNEFDSVNTDNNIFANESDNLNIETNDYIDGDKDTAVFGTNNVLDNFVGVELNAMNFDGTVINTPMHIEAFQENPYTLFALNQSNYGNDFDICSSNGMPQLHIKADGQVLNSENVPIGKMEYGDDGIFRMFDNNNVELASQNKQGFIKSGNYVLGRAENNGELTIFHDFKSNEFYRTDITGTVWSMDGKQLAHIKNV